MSAIKSDWIQTYTGKKFFPLDPNIEDICIEDIAHSLSMQCRFNGHSKEFYSVAQHCVVMARLWFPEEPELKLYALLHDASEAYLSDIPRPLKHLPQFNFYRDAETTLQALIYIKYGLIPVEPERIKRADNEILGEEAMSPLIMSPLHPDWLIRGEGDISFHSWTPKEAETRFLKVFYNEVSQ
jgi:uncharacterized protein